MRTEVIIKADSVDAAVDRILDELKEGANARSLSSRNNSVIYFDGWDGLGASAVLREVSQRLVVRSEAPEGLQFDQIIHIDCSKWEGRRMLQRAITEQLELPDPFMDMFDKQDEEDEFNGVSLESRLEIPQVLRRMHRRIQDLNRRFLVIFHNGSNEEIDLASFGFPLSQYLDNKVLWTFQGRFRLYPRNKVVGAMKSTAGASKTDVFLSARHSLGGRETHELYTVLAQQEAAEVIGQSGIMINTSNGPAQVGKHFLLHMLKLCCMGHNLLMDYDLATHACNYWICDGIIQLQGEENDISTEGDDEGLWRAAGALQSEMRLDVDYYQYEHKYFPSHLVPYGMCTMPNHTAPYGFLAIPAGAIPNSDMFQDFNKLHVLKLSCRTFSFSSPPFIYCRNLKFLWLDHCQDQDNHSSIDDGFSREEDEDKDKITTDGAGAEEDDFRHFFHRLWVLDVRYTCCDKLLSEEMLGFMTQLRELNVMGAQDWDICQLQGHLPNIRKLRVTKSTLKCSKDNLFLGMSKMELLDLSGNRSSQEGMNKIFGICTSSKQLETVMIIDNGWAGIQKLSFKGCVKLRNVLLSGLFEDLHILDLSGTAIKTLDLRAMTAHNIDELLLDYCEELCAILWPPKDKWTISSWKLHIDTAQSAAWLVVPREEKSTEGHTTPTAMRKSAGSLSVVHGGTVPSEFDWCIMVRDARLIRSLVPLIEYFKYPKVAHVEVSSPAVDFGSGKDSEAASSSIKQQHSMEQPKHSWTYEDVAATFTDHEFLQGGSEEGDGDAPTLARIWPCPRIPHLDDLTCYMHIQDHQHAWRTKSMREGPEEAMPDIISAWRTKSKQEDEEETVPGIISEIAGILHVHDSSSITSIPCPDPGSTLPSTWGLLNWCRVERCPNLEDVFTAPKSDPRRAYEKIHFEHLKTFWGSRLLKARCIWDWVTQVLELHELDFYDTYPADKLSFQHLTSLHLELCPRLIFVLASKFTPAYGKKTDLYNYTIGLDNLQTLEIVWCGALTEVFSLYTDTLQTMAISVTFNSLKHIHLHELPMLDGICGPWDVYAPRLETIKVRGCWSLRSLPFLRYRHGLMHGGLDEYDHQPKVHCDCEKEWWDELEWAGHDHRSCYEPTHPRHYKKTLLRGSVLI